MLFGPVLRVLRVSKAFKAWLVHLLTQALKVLPVYKA